MAIMIIDSEGNVVGGDQAENRVPDRDGRDEIPSGYPTTQLEQVVPNSDLIRIQQEREQIIIATLMGHPLA